MGNGSEASSQLISLPKGGGALQGLGEKFSPDLFTGTGNFTVPIALPPGRNGFQPELNLVYSTGGGNGPFGLGWVLSIPGVARKTSKGIPRYQGGDTFILSGAEDLVPIEESDGWTRFRPRTEGLFARIRRHRDSDNDYWTVESKDGLKSVYGTKNSSGNDPAAIADPDDPSKVFTWRLTLTKDPFGNRIEYEYERDPGDPGGIRRWDQLYLKQIRYVDYEAGETVRYLVTINFHYEPRPDPFSEYRSGFEIRTRKRCTRISIQTHADADRLVRTYNFVYVDERPEWEDEFPYNGVSLLKLIVVEGHDGDRTEELPPLEFGFTQFKPEEREFFPLKGHLPTMSLGDPNLDLVDLFGNGLPDIVEMNGTTRYWRNLGDGRFDLPREIREAPAGLAIANAGVQLLDANGDGRTDLLVTQSGLSGYFPLRFDGTWDRRSFQKYNIAPSFDLKDPEVRLVDLSGDGVTDAIRSGTRLECFFNDPNDGWNDTRFIERRTLYDFPNINFSDPRVKWADMSGDGLQDIVLVHDGNVEYWPNLGHGDWGRRVSMRNNPRFPAGYNPEHILIGDVDGDGLADITYVDHCKIFLWINRSGNSWSDSIEIKGTPGLTDFDDVRLTDLLGTGVAGLLWSVGAGRRLHDRIFFLDFTGGLKPYLLNQMDNAMGALTRIEYAPSTRHYLEDEKQPDTSWLTPLPFPVQVVARVEVIDVISKGKLTTEYSYHHGYWDGAEREFRGFGRVDQRDTEAFDHYHSNGLHPGSAFAEIEHERFSPPLETRTWFHQGPIGDEFGEWQESDFSHEFWQDDRNVLSRPPEFESLLRSLRRRDRRDVLRTLRGHILRSELYALDVTERETRHYTVTEHLYSVREEETPAAAEERRCIFFAHALAQRTTQWERGDDPMTQIGFTGDYDAYGQPHQQSAVALPRRAAKRRPITGAVVGEINPDETRILATHSRTEYAVPDSDVYIYNQVAQVRTFEMSSPPGVIESDLSDVGRIIADQAAAATTVHTRFRDALDTWSAGTDLPSGFRLIGHALNHYDGDAFIGRIPGELGPYGVLTRSEALVFTNTELDEAYGDRRPAYIGGSAGPLTGAPGGFGSNIGYRLEAASTVSYHNCYYADTQRLQFDFQESSVTEPRGLVIAVRDPLGNQTDIEHDDYRLLPIRVTNANELRTNADYDYRVLQPHTVMDSNENSTRMHYTPLGLPDKQFFQGRDGEGGTEEHPEIIFGYDFFAYQRTRFDSDPQPIFVHTIRRVHHFNDSNVPLSERDKTIESREFSDGFGRLVQSRAQAGDLLFGDGGDDVGLSAEACSVPEPAVGHHVGDSVVVSGWQVYDNKGQVIEKYEPFFATGWTFQPEHEARQGQHVRLYYDPRGQLIRTVNPDGSEQRVLFGIPPVLSDPSIYSPTPWESFTYDSNDLAPITYDATETLPDGSRRSLADRASASHHLTPANAVIDALGRVICQVQRNGADPGEHWFITRSRYDIRGNLITVTDALGREAFRYAYDFANNTLRNDNIDAGLRTSVLDAAGNLLEYRDSKGSTAIRQYDELNRPTHLWARNEAGARLTLRERMIYGDNDETVSGMNRTTAIGHNLLGKLYKHYDEGGLLHYQDYDFKGNLLTKTRKVISDTAIANDWIADWSAADSVSAIEDQPYQTDSSFDALNRPITLTYPEDITGHRAVLTPNYNRAGALERVELYIEGTTTPYVRQIAYNARGQRVLIVYGNGVMTRYAYDPVLFRLARLRSERYRDDSTEARRVGRGQPLQDFTYTYDLVGNIRTIDDCIPNSGIVGSAQGRNRLTRYFEYDPIYRLTQATGRECRDIGIPRPLADLARCGFIEAPYTGGAPTTNADNAPDLTQAYTENYTYDPMGNILRLNHRARSTWSREFAMANRPWSEWREAETNRLTGFDQGGTSHTFRYDANGNMIQQNSERRHGWDHADRMIGFTIQPEGSTGEPSIETRYLYGSDGLRVKKWVQKNGVGLGASTVYIDELFEHFANNDTGRANNHLHVTDGQQRIAIVRKGAVRPQDAGPPVQYHYGDHLGSCGVVMDENGNWVNKEEYFSYGETSFGSFAKKRYRFTGKERDEESGLYYHGARYYASWLCRWAATDPLAFVDGLNLYQYVRNKPLVLVDPNGRQGAPGPPPEYFRYFNPRAHYRAYVQRQLGAGVSAVETMARTFERYSVEEILTATTNSVRGHQFGIVWGYSGFRPELNDLSRGQGGHYLTSFALGYDPSVVNTSLPPWGGSLREALESNPHRSDLEVTVRMVIGHELVRDQTGSGMAWQAVTEGANAVLQERFGAQYRAATNQDVVDFLFAVNYIVNLGPEGTVDMTELDRWLRPIRERGGIPAAQASEIKGRHGNSIEDLRASALGFAHGQMARDNPSFTKEKQAKWLRRNVGEQPSITGTSQEVRTTEVR